MNKKPTIPFSKAVIKAARYESYIVSILLFVFVWFERDVSSIAILASLAWGGYRMVQAFYIWMAKHEHIMDKKIEYKKMGFDTELLDEEIQVIENQEMNIDV